MEERHFSKMEEGGSKPLSSIIINLRSIRYILKRIQINFKGD